jgi:2-polyprenyl-3-methyl-5-hydroxy-6-metoxy-1,4-benzoquinol methylase
MKEGFEKLNCPVCDCENHSDYLSTFNRFDNDRNENFTIKQCVNCGFVFLNPRPNAEHIGEYYQVDGYDPFLSTGKKISLRDKFYVMLRNINLSGKYKKISALKEKGGKILDIGCATGEFLESFARRNWHCTGVEVDDSARNLAKNKNIKVYASVHDIPADKKFDIITLWHVLEHLHDLNESLKKIESLLHPNGYLVIAVPNINSYDAHIYGKNWIALDTPRHLYHFSIETISRLMSNHHLELKKFHPLLLDIFYNNLMSRTLSKSSTVRMLITTLNSVLKTYVGNRKNSSTLVYYFQKEK